MKWRAVIVLLAIAVGAILPPALPLLSDHGAQVSIGTLDVCHSSVPALASNGETPCVGECPFHAAPPMMIEVRQTAEQSLNPCFTPFQEDRPPKA